MTNEQDLDRKEKAFSDNPVMMGYDNRIFERDLDLGFRFPEGKIITSNGFILLDEAIKRIKENTGYPVILNIGDSSTSGWDSNKVNENPNSPFFNYKTYSDLLREQLFANVINAGVPGYTSYQGRKYLEVLLKKIAEENVNTDYVTIYFGNNDCTYNQIEDKVRLDHKKPSFGSLGERVTAEDCKENLRDMIETTLEYGAKPVLIAPVIRYDWEPGIRADQHREESLEILKKLNGSQLAKEIEMARELYEQGRYKQACEADRILPRLKKDYREAILQTARETKTDLIDVQKQIPVTNSSYFADYCHPLEPVNQMIVDEFSKIRERDVFHKPFSEKVKNLFGKSKTKNIGAPPDIYTLY
ncbi:MAG: GDSL-type esterase/lipase family protein [Candidatus Nanoarchaeia archaeon]|nr:GDSL-type esterase/lipase family protein [Candidatus Nanoarchaeia archaeon]